MTDAALREAQHRAGYIAGEARIQGGASRTETLHDRSLNPAIERPATAARKGRCCGG